MNKILIIGVGGGGINAADKMGLANSEKLFIDFSKNTLNHVSSEGEKILIKCKYRSQCPSIHCGCINDHDFCQNMVREYIDEIRESIKNAFKDEKEML